MLLPSELILALTQVLTLNYKLMLDSALWYVWALIQISSNLIMLQLLKVVCCRLLVKSHDLAPWHMEGVCLLMFCERGRIFFSRTVKFDEIPQLIFKDFT